MTDPIRAALERLIKDSEYLAKGGEDLDRAWAAIAAGKAALAAAPEGEGLSDEEWDALVKRAWGEHALAEGYFTGEQLMDNSDFGNALDLLRKEFARWGRPAHALPVSERLPEPNTKVLAHYFNALGNGRTICAIWVPAKSRSDDAADWDFTEYDKENDKYYWPEGWYEAIENWDDLGWVAVNEGEVAYWQPLPRWPALPMPQGEVE